MFFLLCIITFANLGLDYTFVDVSLLLLIIHAEDLSQHSQNLKRFVYLDLKSKTARC